MPSIRVPSIYEAFINVTIASPRPEAVPSYIIPNAALHDELSAKIGAAFREYKHLGENEVWVSASLRVQTYLPATPSQFYAVRTLDPAGQLVEVDEDFFLDVLRIRYALVFAVLPGAYMADERIGEAFVRHWQKAWKDVLVTGYGMNSIFIPGDSMERDDTKTTIDIMMELGASTATMRFDKSPS